MSSGIFALILDALFSVLQGVVVRGTTNDFTLLQQIYTRIGLAFILSIFLFKPYLNPSKLRKIARREWALLIARATLGYFLGALLWVKGFSSAKLANAAFIDAIPMSSLLAFFILRERVTHKKIFFVFLTFLGAFFISVRDFSHLSVWGAGEILVLISTFFFGVRNISRTWHSKILNNQEITVLLFGMGFLILFVTSLLLGEGFPVTRSIPVWGLIGMGGLLNVGILYFSNYGFEHVQSSIAGIALSIESVFGLGLGFLFYQEIPNLRELIGGVLIVMSIIGVSRLQRVKKKAMV